MKTLNINDIIEKLSVEDLNQLKLNIIACLKHQREHWINNPNNRSEHLKCSILETNRELDLIIKELKEK